VKAPTGSACRAGNRVQQRLMPQRVDKKIEDARHLAEEVVPATRHEPRFVDSGAHPEEDDQAIAPPG
jgi:hypothetical protein